ncbi:MULTISPECIES: hypothetical protein [Fibrobacter]|uniref:Uncharacterized protein n=1 Tax=Fibrobacter intestinalis TaxID=28122 RepID=A0A1M6V2C7_9BACT|nr:MULTISPECIES: hypothetical protein [Fibrobacter]SHK75446.1 hypothetical protein SAMN05720469_11644 [Fibrobacter intestinalis]
MKNENKDVALQATRDAVDGAILQLTTHVFGVWFVGKLSCLYRGQ